MPATLSEGVAIDKGGVRGFLHAAEGSKVAALVLTHGAGGNCNAPLLVALAAAFNKAGNYFMAQETGEVDLINPLTTTRTFVLSVAYPPTGMVVDSNRGHIFLSNRYNNTIDVFTTKGVHITTIQ